MKTTTRICFLVLVAGLALAVTWLLLKAPVRGTRTPEQPQTIRVDSQPRALSSKTGGQQPAVPVATQRQRIPKPDSIPASVYSIVSPEVGASYRTRIEAVHALLPPLTQQEADAFYWYLGMPAQTSGDRVNENWLRNEMLDKLVQAIPFPSGLPALLIAIHQDPGQDVVMRDYALQHMAPAYPNVSANEKVTLQQALWHAIDDIDSSMGGTALLALRDLSQDHAEFDRQSIGDNALRLAGNDRCGEFARITAVQMCGQMAIRQAGPLLLRLVQDAPSTPLKIAAIAALGDIGENDARNYLLQLASANESRLTPALKLALKKLNQRLGI